MINTCVPLNWESRLVSDQCPFCSLTNFVTSNSVGLVLRDAFPLTEGHTLIVPRRHIASLFEMTAVEQAKLWQLVDEVRSALVEQFHPDAFNIGINDGKAAGQTIPHAHIHVVPRYRGDVADPRGGVRWVIPQKAAYWEVRS